VGPFAAAGFAAGAAGFRDADISALLPDRKSTRAFAHEKHTKAPEGAATGAVAGTVTGGVVGLLMGLGAIAIPGLGAFLAAGPLMGALAGAGAAGRLSMLLATGAAGLAASWLRRLWTASGLAKERPGAIFSAVASDSRARSI
jgi:hypothetical protein